jgi:hypothetical protein
MKCVKCGKDAPVAVIVPQVGPVDFCSKHFKEWRSEQ